MSFIRCVSPRTFKGLSVRCKTCVGCQRLRQYEWRCCIEWEIARADRTWWCTLTYSDEKLSGEMKYVEFQAFAKRVRKAGHAVRYVVATERGTAAGRLHFHALIHVAASVRRRDLDRHWSAGFLHMRLAAGRHVRYIAKYATKDGTLRSSLGYGLQPVHRELPGFGLCEVTRMGVHRRPWKQVKKQIKAAYLELQQLDPRPDWLCRCPGLSRPAAGECPDCGLEIITTLAAFDRQNHPTSGGKAEAPASPLGPVPGGLDGGLWPAVSPETPWGDPASPLTPMEWIWTDEITYDD